MLFRAELDPEVVEESSNVDGVLLEEMATLVVSDGDDGIYDALWNEEFDAENMLMRR